MGVEVALSRWSGYLIVVHVIHIGIIHTINAGCKYGQEWIGWNDLYKGIFKIFGWSGGYGYSNCRGDLIP